jgi:hypothetical protein
VFQPAGMNRPFHVTCTHQEGANNANHDISLGGYPAMDAAQTNAEVEKEDII